MSIGFDDLSAKAQRQALEKYKGQERETKVPASALTGGKRNKYGNEITDVANIRFHSKKEARRFEDLIVMEREGFIRELRLQHNFTLQEAYTTTTGVRVQAIRYKADFTYERATKPDITGEVHWIKVVEDVKSRPTRTKDYIIKKKMMQERLGITILEI